MSGTHLVTSGLLRSAQMTCIVQVFNLDADYTTIVHTRWCLRAKCFRESQRNVAVLLRRVGIALVLEKGKGANCFGPCLRRSDYFVDEAAPAAMYGFANLQALDLRSTCAFLVLCFTQTLAGKEYRPRPQRPSRLSPPPAREVYVPCECVYRP